jgi:hypothetical protein
MKLGLVGALGMTLWISAARAGEPGEVSLKWSELAPAVADKKVAMVLPDGTSIEGKVRQVEAGGLRLRVSKTSNRRVVPKGDGLIPRKAVSVLRLTDYRKIGRILCTAGAVAASAIAVASADIDVYEGPAVIVVPAVSAAGTIGLGVAGYYIGKRIDRSVVYIRVVPE